LQGQIIAFVLFFVIFVLLKVTQVMTINQITASKIKEIRIKQGLSAEKIAEQLGIAKSNYSLLENGKVEINLSRLEALSKILKMPLEALLPTNSKNQTIQIANGDHSTVNEVNGTQINNYTDAKLLENINTAIQSLEFILSKMK